MKTPIKNTTARQNAGQWYFYLTAVKKIAIFAD